MDTDELIASIKKHFSFLFSQHKFTVLRVIETGRDNAVRSIVLKANHCRIRISAELYLGLNLGNQDSDTESLLWDPKLGWWRADALEAFLAGELIDWDFEPGVSDRGVAELANKYKGRLEEMIEMMRNPETWQDDYKKFFDAEFDQYMTKLMGRNWRTSLGTN